jgi:hypothetical protein
VSRRLQGGSLLQLKARCKARRRLSCGPSRGVVPVSLEPGSSLVSRALDGTELLLLPAPFSFLACILRLVFHAHVTLDPKLFPILLVSRIRRRCLPSGLVLLHPTRIPTLLSCDPGGFSPPTGSYSECKRHEKQVYD